MTESEDYGWWLKRFETLTPSQARWSLDVIGKYADANNQAMMRALRDRAAQ